MTTTESKPTSVGVSTATGTGSRGTRIVGIGTIIAMGWLVAFGLVFSPEDRDQGEAVRILYVHVPTIWVAYLAFIVTAVASATYLLRRRSRSPGTASPAPAPRSARHSWQSRW